MPARLNFYIFIVYFKSSVCYYSFSGPSGRLNQFRLSLTNAGGMKVL